jgi:hypothetical protein
MTRYILGVKSLIKYEKKARMLKSIREMAGNLGTTDFRRSKKVTRFFSYSAGLFLMKIYIYDGFSYMYRVLLSTVSTSSFGVSGLTIILI